MNRTETAKKMISALKEEALAFGFDWPTAEIETATAADLESFLTEVEEFLRGEK